MKASVIVPIQVSEPIFSIFLENLPFCAESVRNQSIDCEFILVDYNSSRQFQDQIESIAHKFSARLVHDDRPDKLWARGRALNVGIRAALGDLLLFVDADCVLPNNYVEDHAAIIDEKVFTFSEFYLTRSGVHKTGNYKNLISQKDCILPPYETCCSHQGILRSTVQAVGMFDEQYRGWGFEEHDYILTLKNRGITSKKCQAMPIHLYHPTWQDLMAAVGRNDEQRISRSKNKSRFFQRVGKKT